MKQIQQQYSGFKNTPFLWRNIAIIGLQQFDFQTSKTHLFQQELKENLRLGKLVERFVSAELQQDSSIEILLENIQIQDDKLTLGELDCLLLKNGKPIHLEIVYKFYLYDKSVGNSEIEHWIGPNRRDSFIQKLTKLKDKQLPLLYHEKTTSYLSEVNLSSEDIIQKVYFKAQLFVPLANFGTSYKEINNDCIYGFYIYPNELQLFSDSKFYIPTKQNWLVDVHPNIKWMNFDDFHSKINEFIIENNAPLCWLKKTNGQLFKFFVVWWD